MNNKKNSFPVLHLLAIATNKTIMTDFDKLKSELAVLYPDKKKRQGVCLFRFGVKNYFLGRFCIILYSMPGHTHSPITSRIKVSLLRAKSGIL